MSEEEIIEKFKKCEVVDYLEDDYTTTMDWVKDGVLDIIEKQQKEIEKLKFANKVLDNCLNDFYKIKD